MIRSFIVFLFLLFSSGALTAQEQEHASTSLPLDVNADTLSVDQDNGRAIFSGNAVATQGAMELRADEISVAYDVEKGQITDIIAIGKITFMRPDSKGSAQRAQYDVDNQTLLLNGDVKLHQGQTIVTGDKLVYDVRRDTAKMSGNVRTKFVPK